MKTKNEVTATQTLNVVTPKKHSVRFDADPTDKQPMFTGIYLSRAAASKLLLTDNLDAVKGIEIAVKILL